MVRRTTSPKRDAQNADVRGRRPDRLSALDAVFLSLETATQQMNVGSVLVLEGPAPEFADLSQHIAQRLDSVPRYRQRVRPSRLGIARPTWVDDPGFALADHLYCTQLAAPGTDDDLRSLVGRVMAQRLDLRRPLWEMWMVDGLAGGRWAAIAKAHHTMVDGVSGDDLLEALLDESRVPDRQQPWPHAASGPRIGSEAVRQARTHRSPAARVREARTRLRGLARVGHADLPDSILSGPLGPGRRWSWTEADLAAVKALRAATGSTVNDVVLAAVAGGLRTYLIGRGQVVDGLVVRCIVPVSTRARGERGQPGNRAAAVFVELPVGLTGARERLADVARQMDELKASEMTKGVLLGLRAADFVPHAVLARATLAYARAGQRRVNLITTNVPGPRHPLYLLGRELRSLLPYVSIGQEIRIAVGVLSYDGRLAFGVTGDAASMPDVGQLCTAVETSLDELVGLAAR